MIEYFTALFSAKSLKKLSLVLAVVFVPTFSISRNASAASYEACIRNDSDYPVIVQWGFHGGSWDEIVIGKGDSHRFPTSLSPGEQFNRRLLIGLYDRSRSSGKSNYSVIPSPSANGKCFSAAKIVSDGRGQFRLRGIGDRPEFTEKGHWSDDCGGWCRNRN
ncbi:hypothetical protein C1752_09721 [Acaryochloris thomasi RCC1774]|uniref:Uncharacterized protein n=1 Tax=Acaryochloris thomasi RCC1774 TaxID=1764569 RepID=A0A2W1JKL2_9CYAN|nr:hypothetical protein [Acaryochloris thomasi]PZD70744.1 hypothetical protein C1752_09721 [Acaryochloris thomasi RCC1774]